MRVAGELKLDGDKIVLQQGGNATTITSNTPASDITLTLPATTDSLVGRATTDTLTNKTLTSPKINEDVVLTATATELNQLDGVTVGGTAAGDIVSIDGDQTLTGKTIAAADNTITTAASGNLASTELNAALAELQGSIDVRVLTTDFDAHVDDFDTHTGALAAHGASGAVVGTNNTQTLLNKTLTNPKINDTIALTATSTELNYVKNVTSAIQTQLDGKQATLTTGTSAQYLKGDLTLGTFATDVAATAAVAANTAKTFDTLAPTTTKGDLPVHDGTNNVRLPVGSDGQVLTADSGETSGLSWTSPLTNPMTTEGDIIIGGASGAATRLAKGADNQVLRTESGSVVWSDGIATSSTAGLVNSFAGDSQDLESGTYTPTLTGTENVNTASAFVCQYLRVGKCVTVSGIFNVDPASGTAGTSTTLTISVPSHLPVANVLSVPVGGTAASANGDVLAIDNSSTTAVRAKGKPQTVTNSTYAFSFTYRMD